MISNNNKSTPEHPLVTIVALCYNQAQYAEETLDSILAQTYPNIQLIIMDDASSDNSVDVINKWIDKNKVDCTFIAHEENQGICRTLNEAIELVSGKYYQAIACDDVLINTKLQKQIDFFKENPDYTLVCSNFQEINSNSEIIKPQFYTNNYIFPKIDNVFSAILTGHEGYGIIVHSPTVLICSSIHKKVGYYIEDILQEDLYMWLKISSVSKIGYIPDITVKYRIHPKSLSKNKKTLNRLYEDRLKVGSLFISSTKMNHDALWGHQKRYLNYFSHELQKGNITIQKFFNILNTYADEKNKIQITNSKTFDLTILKSFINNKKGTIIALKHNSISPRNTIYRFLIMPYSSIIFAKLFLKLKSVLKK